MHHIGYKFAMESRGAQKRLRVLFTGRVQGVGFRYSVCRVAENARVTGFVRNLMDGDVELVAEGTEQDLIDFLNRIRASHTGRSVISERMQWFAASGDYDSFGISI